MKKLVKNLLFGAGIAAVGWAVYSLWKDAEEPVVVQNTDTEPTTTPSKEYVEHRRQQIRDVADAKKAVQQESAQEETAQEKAVLEGADQEKAPDTAPVEAPPSEQATELQEEQ